MFSETGTRCCKNYKRNRRFLNDASGMPNLNKLSDTCVPEKEIPNEKIHVMNEVQSALHITNTDI